MTGVQSHGSMLPDGTTCLMHCCGHLEILNSSGTRNLTFTFFVGPAKLCSLSTFEVQVCGYVCGCLHTNFVYFYRAPFSQVHFSIFKSVFLANEIVCKQIQSSHSVQISP